MQQSISPKHIFPLSDDAQRLLRIALTYQPMEDASKVMDACVREYAQAAIAQGYRAEELCVWGLPSYGYNIQVRFGKERSILTLWVRRQWRKLVPYKAAA
jgi:hypothetical protein